MIENHIDRKERVLLQDLRNRIAAGSFDELDASNFWMQLRERTDHPWIREFGDFVVHRSRDMGRIFDRIKEISEAMKSLVSGNENRIAELLRQQIFSSDQPAERINADLARINLEPMDKQSINELLVVTIFLLQGVIIEDPPKEHPRMRRKYTGMGRAGPGLAVLQPTLYRVPGTERRVYVTAMISLPHQPGVIHQIPVIGITDHWFPSGGHSTPKQVVRIRFRNHVLDVDVVR